MRKNSTRLALQRAKRKAILETQRERLFSAAVFSKILYLIRFYACNRDESIISTADVHPSENNHDEVDSANFAVVDFLTRQYLLFRE